MDQWQDRKTGDNRTKEFIRAQQIHIVDTGVDPKEESRPNRDRDPREMGGNPQGRQRQQRRETDYPMDYADEDIPF
jgi:hypothetical protein